MSTVSAKIDIEAPIERVWETVMDPRRLGDWVTIHKSVSNVSDPPLRAGSTMDQSMHVRGLTFKVHWTLMAVDSPHRAEWEGGGPAHSTAVIRYELASDDDGRDNISVHQRVPRARWTSRQRRQSHDRRRHLRA